MKNQDYIDELLGKYFAHETLTKNEQNDLNIWIKNNPEDFERLCSLMNLTDNKQEKEHLFDADKAWNRIVPQLKENQKRSIPVWTIITSVAATLVLAWLGIHSLRSTSDKDFYASLSNKSSQIESHLLPDSSKIILFPGSEIQYRIDPSKGKRKVALNGKAFFEVKKSHDRPFIIDAHQIQVEVVGTSFIIDASLDNQACVEVKTGHVRVSSDYHSVELRSNEKAEINGKRIQKGAIADSESTFGFVNKKLIFKDENIEKIIRDIEIVSGVKIEYAPSIGQNKITANLDLNNPKQAIEEIAFMCRCDIEQIDSLHYRFRNKDNP